MTPKFAIRIPYRFATEIGRLRTFAGLQIALLDDTIWICGAELHDELDRALKSLPECESCQVLADGHLVSAGHLVPSGNLPQLNWKPIRQAVVPEIPAAAYAGRLETRLEIELVDSYVERDANVLITPFDRLQQWAMQAPEIRLRPLRFAVRNAGENLALIHGSPLPPIHGARYSESVGIATPLGMAWRPALSASQLAAFWKLEPGDLCLWNAESRVLIRGDQFVVLTRSSIAATRRQIGGDRP